MKIDDLYINVGDESYINIPSLYQLNADVYIIFGERSAGKTYSVLKGIFDEYQQSGGQFVYMRTREDYLKGGRARGAVANIKKYVEHDLWKDEALLDYYVGAYRKKEVGRKNNWVYTDVGYTMTVGAWSKYKGNGYDGVTTIFLDEFIEDTDTSTIRPLSKDEFLKGWAQNLSTIIRKRTNVKVVCCANSLNPTSPLFYYYNIDARKIKQGNVYIFNRDVEGENMKICVLYTEPQKRSHVDKHIAVYESQTTEMTMKGTWQEENYSNHYQGKPWRWYADLSQKSSRIYIRDYAVTIIFPYSNELPLTIVNGKYKAKIELSITDIYLPTGVRIGQYIMLYKRIGKIITDSDVTSQKINDIIKRLLIDKN